jgi:hypothetical protein
MIEAEAAEAAEEDVLDRIDDVEALSRRVCTKDQKDDHFE